MGLYNTSMIIVLVFSLLHSTASSKESNGACVSHPQDIIFLIDTSTSIRDSNPPDYVENTPSDNWYQLKSFISRMVAILLTASSSVFLPKIGFVTFASDVNAESSTMLTDDIYKLNIALANLKYTGGGTNIAAGLRNAQKLLNSDIAVGTSKVIVLITDGQSNIERENTLQVSSENKLKNTTQCVVGITDYINPDELGKIASRPEYFMTAKNFNHLYSFINRLLPILYCPIPPKPPICVNAKADIAILLDQSGSIGTDNKNWPTMKEFVVNFTKNFMIDEERVKFSLLTFNRIINVTFRFNQSLSVANIQNKLDLLDSPAGETYTQGAINTMMLDLFTKQSGDRPNVQNIGLLITDGAPHVELENKTIISSAIKEANEAKTRGIIIYGIGLTSEINVTEMTASVSNPVDSHFYTTKTIPDIKTILSSILINICSETTSLANYKKCDNNQVLSWKIERGMVLVGHDNFKFIDVPDIQTCENKCFEIYHCRSFEYMSDYNECFLSYFVRTDFRSDFKTDSQVDYHEVLCS